MSGESVTRRVGAGPPRGGWPTLVSGDADNGISPGETLNRGGGSGLITLSNKSVTEGIIFQFVMT